MQLSVSTYEARIHANCRTIYARPAEKFHGENTVFIAHCTKCGHSWKAQARTLMIMHGCKYCKRLTLPKIRNFVHSKHPFLRIYGHVNGEHNQLLVVCLTCKKAGRPYKWHSDVSNLLEGKGCKYCENKKNGFNKLHSFRAYENKTFHKYHNIIKVHPLRPLIQHQYVRKNDHIVAYCKKHNFIWITTFQILLSHTAIGCPAVSMHKCRRKQVSASQDTFVKWYRKQYWVKLLDKPPYDYKSTNTVFYVKCLICGNKYHATAHALMKDLGHGCHYCASRIKVYSNVHKGKEHLMYWYKHQNYLKIVHWPYVLKHYHTNREKVLCVCLKCNNKWCTEINHLLNGTKCPNCVKGAISHGEDMVGDYLQKHHFKPQLQKYELIKSGHYIHGYHLHNVKQWSHQLHLDFLLNINGKLIGIEFDGVQHFRPEDFGGKYTSSQLMHRFYTTHDRDKRTTKYCATHNIKLIRVKNKTDVESKSKMELLVKSSLDRQLHIPKNLKVEPIAHQLSLF